MFLVEEKVNTRPECICRRKIKRQHKGVQGYEAISLPKDENNIPYKV